MSSLTSRACQEWELADSSPQTCPAIGRSVNRCGAKRVWLLAFRVFCTPSAWLRELVSRYLGGLEAREVRLRQSLDGKLEKAQKNC
jgi:hypothetical protein